MKALKFLVGFLIGVAGVFVGTTLVSAQDASDAVSEQEVPAVLVASVNLYEATIVSQNGSTFTLSFDLSNGAGIQPGVKYAVQLFKQQEDGTASLVDQKVYPETIVLGENETIHKTVEYTAPQFLKGTYQMLIVSENKNGLPLALGGVGDVVLKGTGTYVEILEDSCVLRVSGEPDDMVYYLLQGVDVAPEESLTLTCDAANRFDRALTAKPVFEIHHRTTFGDIVDAGVSNVSEISFKPKETKKISLTIPKPALPQAYDAIMMMQENDVVVSNSVVAHFVVRGASATIQNVVFDKNSYLQGDVAHVSFVWTPSADIFPDSRAVAGTDISGGVTAEVTIVDGNGDLCADPFSQTFLGESVKEVVDVSIVKDCVAPVGTATLRDGNGTVLDSVSYALNPTGVVVPQEFPTSDTNYPMLLAIVSLLVIAGAGVYWFVTSKKTPTTIPPVALFVVLLAGLAVVSFGINVEEAKAATWVVGTNAGGTSTGGNTKTGEQSFFTYQTGLNKPSYTTGETVVVSWRMQGLGCANGLWGNIHAGVDNGTKNQIPGATYSIDNNGQHWNIRRPLLVGVYSGINAPTTPGAHTVDFRFYFRSQAYYDTGNIYSYASVPFSVLTPVNGGWSYTLWGACSAMCGNGGVQTRTTNMCDNPAPANGGANCPAPLPADLTRACDPVPSACTVSLIADPSSVVRHGEARLSWDSNAHHCTASDGRAGWAGVNKPPSGQNWPTGQIPSDTTYTITCFGDATESISSGPAMASITIRPPECSDTSDNDGDLRQNQLDPGCYPGGDMTKPYDPLDDNESDEPMCENNKDDDGDTYVDEDDPGCHTKAPNADYDPMNNASYDPLSNQEDNCGNNICEKNYGETLGTCAKDCPYGWTQD